MEILLFLRSVVYQLPTVGSSYGVDAYGAINVRWLGRNGAEGQSGAFTPPGVKAEPTCTEPDIPRGEQGRHG